jgi:hypothetical protein
MAIEDIIAAAIADGGPVSDEMSAATRVVAALKKAGVSLEMPVAYEPKPYPKWVGDKVVRTAAEEAALTEKAAPAAEPAPAAPANDATPPAPAA